MRYTILIYSILLFTACQANPKQTAKEQTPSDTVAQVQTRFPYPEIPSVLTTPEDRKAYLLTHYWERFDFADTALVAERDITEQGFVDFIALLADGQTTDALAKESMENWCGGFIPQAQARRTMTGLADDYLYNPNSPFYNAVVPFGQGFKDMSPPTKELMKLVLEERIAHGGHPVLRWMMDNIYIRTDPAGNIKPDKEKSTEKIDGAVATIMALDRAIRCGNDTSESVYDSRGLLFL